jgi:hypothetical protein
MLTICDITFCRQKRKTIRSFPSKIFFTTDSSEMFLSAPRALEGARTSEGQWSFTFFSFTVNPPLSWHNYRNVKWYLIQITVAESYTLARPTPIPCYPHSLNTFQKSHFSNITLHIGPQLTELRKTLLVFDLRKPNYSVKCRCVCIPLRKTLLVFDLRKPNYSVKYRCVCIPLLFRDHTPRPPAHKNFVWCVSTQKLT